MRMIRYIKKLTTIPPVRRQDSVSKYRIGSTILISSAIATEKELWSRKSEGMSEEICPLGECNILFIPSAPIDTALQFHLALIQIQKMRIKNFLICHDRI